MKLRPVLDAFARAPATADLAERLPARGATLRLGGLAGSSGSVLAAWIANTQPHRQVVVVATTPPEAERWLTDLGLLTDGPVALYPQREALGEEEPHYENAGERAETLEALLRGQVRIVLTGRTVTSCSPSRERWVVRSNPRMEVMSSPHHSSRAGTAIPKP